MTTSLTFRNTQFNIANHSGKIWLRGTEIAKALSMSKSDGVSQIYHRNADEFSDAMTQTLNLRVPGSGSGELTRKVRIFSLRGAHLIAMFARTPVAKEFRRWVLDVLEKEVGTSEIIPVKPVIKSRSEIIYYENDIPVARRLLGEDEIPMNPDSCLEHVMRSGFVIIPCDEMGKMTLDELWLMAEETKKLRDRVEENHRQLAARYDF